MRKPRIRPGTLAPAGLALGLACGVPPGTVAWDEMAAEPGRIYRWTFDEPHPDALAESLVGVLGNWRIEGEASAPSTPNVLRQTGSFESSEFPRVIVRDLTFTDLTLRVRCRPEAGSVDQACGLVFRARDLDDYYVTRANGLEENIRLYAVVGGRRKQLASSELDVTSGEWHTLEVRARGTSLFVSWDGRQVISTTDGTFDRGKIGLWTKADSVTAFDDLEARTD